MNAEQHTAAPNTPHAGIDDSDDEINLGEIIATLLEYKWLIAVVTFFATLLGAVWLYIATPIYQADALLQIEDKKAAGLTALAELQPLLGDSVSITAQLEILNSRMILGRVVNQLKLDIDARPNYMPVFGRAIARRYADEGLAAPMFGLDQFAWGGEKIRIESLEVQLFNEADIPWDDLAFRTVSLTLRRFFEARARGDYSLYTDRVVPPPHHRLDAARPPHRP